MVSGKFLLFAISMGASLGLCAILGYLAERYRIVPKASFRRKDDVVVPLLGGVGIWFSVLIANTQYQNEYIWKLLVATIPLLVVGFLDDLFEVRARTKLVSQMLSAICWIGLNSPSEMLFTKMGLPAFAGAILTIVFLIGVANAFNFLDGVDGQTSFMFIAIMLTLGFVVPEFESIGFVLVGAAFGFFLLNFPPARIYLGEVGSSFLGFSVAALSTQVPIQGSRFSLFISLCFLFALPFCDSLHAVTRRALKGLAPWTPDRDHFHHRLEKIGLNSKAVLLISSFIVFNSCLTVVAINRAEGSLGYLYAFTSGSLLIFIYLSVVLLPHLLGQKISHFGRSLIERHLQLEADPGHLPSKGHCVVIDLLPYYSDMQSRGIYLIDKFVRATAVFVGSLKEKHSVHLIGSYSIAIVFSNETTWNDFFKKRIAVGFREVLIEYKALRSQKPIPEGFYYYDDLSQKDIRALLAGLQNAQKDSFVA